MNIGGRKGARGKGAKGQGNKIKVSIKPLLESMSSY